MATKISDKDRRLAAEALRKRQAKEPLSKSEESALRRVQGQVEEQRALGFIAAVPIGLLATHTGRQHKVLYGFRDVHGLPIAAETDLWALLTSLFDLLAKNKYRLRSGGDDENLNEIELRKKIEKLEVEIEQRRHKLEADKKASIRVDELHASFGVIAEQLRALARIMSKHGRPVYRDFEQWRDATLADWRQRRLLIDQPAEPEEEPAAKPRGGGRKKKSTTPRRAV